jgi:hypothetical protein
LFESRKVFNVICRHAIKLISCEALWPGWWRKKNIQAPKLDREKVIFKGGSVSMRFAASILSALVLLTACLAANVAAIQDPGTISVGAGESLADKLIEASNDPGVLVSDTGFAATPGESKKQWANSTGVDFTMPESLSASGNSAKESRAAAEATKSEQTEDTVDEEAPAAEDTAATEPETSSSGAATAGGSWSFTLDESTPKEMVLTLFQSGDAVFGTGSINTGDSTLVVAASGTADSDSMDLDVTSIGTISLYRMALNLDGDSASGSYDAFAASGDTWTGNAHGVRSVSQ